VKVSQASAYALHAMMYMVRHMTQLPVTNGVIAQAEGMPAGYLAKVMQQLTRAGFVRSVRGRHRGYVFVRSPEEISLLELFETLDGRSLFGDCPLRHCACGGTQQNCSILAQWMNCTEKIRNLMAQTSVVTAAWNHPEHRFNELPDFDLEQNPLRA
jgi:Rrf2 family protein